MKKRLSIAASIIFLYSLSKFSLNLVQNWQGLASKTRVDEVGLALLFLGLMLQLWQEKSATAWMPMITTAIAFSTATQLMMVR